MFPMFDFNPEWKYGTGTHNFRDIYEEDPIALLVLCMRTPKMKNRGSVEKANQIPPTIMLLD